MKGEERKKETMRNATSQRVKEAASWRCRLSLMSDSGSGVDMDGSDLGNGGKRWGVDNGMGVGVGMRMGI
jgi:hypothetical protein